MTIARQDDAYFEALGKPKPGQPFGTLEHYRFWLVYKHLAQGSVLDVGVYFGDFLKLALRDGRKIMGTEVNTVRKDLTNSILGEDVVVVDFRNGKLAKFEDGSVGNVVAMEVVEHVPDVRFAIAELCRVARKRVILTVPFREKLQSVLCIHCNTYTPHSGHLHSFDCGAFAELAPDNWRVSKELAFANRLVRRFSALLPEAPGSSKILSMLDKVRVGSGHWLLAVLEPCDDKRGH